MAACQLPHTRSCRETPQQLPLPSGWGVSKHPTGTVSITHPLQTPRSKEPTPVLRKLAPPITNKHKRRMMTTMTTTTTTTETKASVMNRIDRKDDDIINGIDFGDFNRRAERRASNCERAVMPSLDHLSMRDYDLVYEPSDDTYLLLDGLSCALKEMVFDTNMTNETRERSFPRANESDFQGLEEEGPDDEGGVVGGTRQKEDEKTETHCVDVDYEEGDGKGEGSYYGEDDDDDDPFLTVEIGCGTGVPTVFVARELARKEAMAPTSTSSGRSSTSSSSSPLLESSRLRRTNRRRRCRHIVTDINADALRIARSTFRENVVASSSSSSSSEQEEEEVRTTTTSNSTKTKPLLLEAHRCDLASDLLTVHRNGVDILIFNPPYVPTPDEEVGRSEGGIEASWAGGRDGRRVIDRAVPQIPVLLRKPHGVGFLVTVDDNRPEELAVQFRRHGIHMEPWVRRRARNEYLTVQKLTWPSP